MKKIRLFAALLVVALAFTSCGNNNRIVGTWQANTGICTITLTYYANGNFVQRGCLGAIQGTFVLQQNSITATVGAVSETNTIEFVDRNTFNLSLNAMPGVTFTFRRIE